MLFDIGFSEMVVIVVFILIAVGPDRLPTMVKTVARMYRQVRRTAQDLRASTGIDDFLRDEELRELAELRKQKLATLALAKPKTKVPTGQSPPIAPAAKAAAPASPQTPGSSRPQNETSTAVAEPNSTDSKSAPRSGANPAARPAANPAANAQPAAKPSAPLMSAAAQENPPEGVDIVEERHAREHAKAIENASSEVSS